jgi:hypothetical protein
LGAVGTYSFISLRKSEPQLLNDVYNNPDILCISERHLSADELSMFLMTKYKMATSFSRKISKNGGFRILVKNNITYQKLGLNKLSREKVFEACAVKIIISNKNLGILCVYRVPDGNIDQFIDQLDATLSYLVSLKLEPIIGGDTNINYLKDNQRKMQLQSLLDTYNLAQIIDYPTSCLYPYPESSYSIHYSLPSVYTIFTFILPVHATQLVNSVTTGGLNRTTT